MNNRSRETHERSSMPPIARGTIRWRMTFLAVCLGLALLVATSRAVMMQTVEAPQLQHEAAKGYVRTETLDDWRGDILDRNGRLVATTVHRWALTADPQEVRDAVKTAELLAPVVGMTAADIAQRLDPSTSRGIAATSATDDPVVNPTASLARTYSDQMAQTVGRLWGRSTSYFERRLDIMEKFFQLEQLQNPAVFGTVELLASAAERTADAIAADVDKLRLFAMHGRRFTYIARDLDDEVVRKLAAARDAEDLRCKEAREVGEKCKNQLAAVLARPEPRRYYPKRELGSQIVGLVGRDEKGLSGVERALDGFLSGGLGRVTVIKDQRGRRIFLNGLPENTPLVASSVELALDEQIQAIAEREIGRACLSSGARAGYAVVMRPKTGELLAIANFPTYNPNTFQEWFREQQPLRDERQQLTQRRNDLAWAGTWRLNARAFGGSEQVEAAKREHIASLSQEIDAYTEYQHSFPNASRSAALLDVYEPGSIMKVFTASAALEEGVIDLDTNFELENGDWELPDGEGNTIHDITSVSEGNVGTILKKSSNIGASKIAFLLGASKLEKYLRDFGFGASTKSGFPGEARGLLRPADEWAPIELANVSFGQGMAVTGIQLAMALGAIANEGKLMKPLLVKRVVDGEGREVAAWKPEVVRQVISPKTARTVLDLMQTVVEPDGTGRRAYLPEYPVAGKTGTGQKPHLRKRGYSEEMWVNTFFGVAPADNPELVIAILIDEPKSKRHGGGLIAAPAFRRIMEQSLHLLGVPSPYAAAKRVAYLDPALLSERRASEESDAGANEPADDVLVDDGTGEIAVPDFRGLTMRAARRVGAARGLALRFEGTGLAVDQNVAPDTRVLPGDVVTVTFASRLPDGKPDAAGAMPRSPGAIGDGSFESALPIAPGPDGGPP